MINVCFEITGNSLCLDLKEQIRDGTSTTKIAHTKATKVTETEQQAKNRKNGDLDVTKGLQESWENYDKCYMRERNKGEYKIPLYYHT